MPNWCCGSVQVEGKPKDIENFCKLFVFDEQVDKHNKKKPYFARSFMNMSWKQFKEQYLGKSQANFIVDFAWSVTSCLIDGYPQKSEGENITLMEACKKFKVKVIIDSEEGGMCFEEHIVCNSKGELELDECNDMPTYKCKCGNEISRPTDCCLEDEECDECGKVGKFKLVKEK